MMSPARVAVAATLGAVFLLAEPAAQEPRVTGVAEGFAAYARGEFDHITGTIGRVADRIGFARELRRQAPAWIDAAGPDQVPRRRLVVAAVAVEAALAMPPLDAESAMAVELIQWACRLVRRNPARSEAERLWHHTALAVLQRIVVFVRLPRTYVREEVRPHLNHGRDRYPDDPAWRLAAAGWVEAGAWYLNPVSSRAVPADPARQAIRAYEKLLADEEVGAEARLRTGYLEFRRGNSDVALAHVLQVEASSTDRLLLYLAAFVRGQISEDAGRMDDAAEAYEAALERWPGGESAATALTAIRFRQERRPQALALAELSLRTPVREDPWRRYGRGDHRLPDLLDRLRGALQ